VASHALLQRTGGGLEFVALRVSGCRVETFGELLAALDAGRHSNGFPVGGLAGNVGGYNRMTKHTATPVAPETRVATAA
jgi:hypothetical protein